MEKKLRIGFIINQSNKLPAWYFETIQRIVSEGRDELFFLKIPVEKAARSSLFYSLFQRFENSWFKNEYDAARPVSADPFLNKNNNVSLDPIKELIFNDDDLQKISGLHFDLFYTISFNDGVRENISALAEYGLWYTRFGHGKFTQTPPAFWEVMQHSPITGSSLLAKKENNAWLLYEGTTRSIPYSAKNNFNSIAWKSSSYLGYRLRELSNAAENFLSRFEPATKAPQGNNIPGISMPFLFARNIAGYLSYKLKEKLSKKKFTLLYAFEDFSPESFKKIKFNSIALPAGRFYADPFLITKDDIHHIFFEEYLYEAGKAHISVIEIKNKEIAAPRTVLKTPYHLSYPFIFSYEGNYYMIPESVANKTVELYKAENFPDRWVFVMNLMEGVELIDVTLHFYEDRWWLFANNANHPFVSTNDQLLLFYSDALFSNNWSAHHQNPIATHIDNCRPAGRIFSQGKKLFRPAQNNASEQYGYGLKINEVMILNENEYREREVLSVEPKELGLKAIHHLDFSRGIVVIDGIV
jgi:hypothetical protein